MEDANASHEEALEARDEMETQETNEEVETSKPQEPEKAEKSNDRQPTAEEFRAMDGAKKHFEAETKRLKDELSKRVAQPTTGDPMEAVRLGKALASHNEEEADVVITYAKGKFNTLTPTPEQIIQASKDEWVVAAISSKREKIKGEAKTPVPSSPSSSIGGKTAEDLEKMDSKDFAKFVSNESKVGRTGI